MERGHFSKTPLFLALGAVALVAACDVDVQDKGELPDVDVTAEEGKLPEYEVRQTEEGKLPDVDVDATGGRMPDVDVRGPDVDVEREPVTVPDVDVQVEEKEITVPTLDIDAPKEEGG